MRECVAVNRSQRFQRFHKVKKIPSVKRVLDETPLGLEFHLFFFIRSPLGRTCMLKRALVFIVRKKGPDRIDSVRHNA